MKFALALENCSKAGNRAAFGIPAAPADADIVAEPPARRPATPGWAAGGLGPNLDLQASLSGSRPRERDRLRATHEQDQCAPKVHAVGFGEIAAHGAQHRGT